MTLAYLDCFAGISGDMALGALVDAGADIDALRSELDKLHLHEFEITAEKVVKRGISATDVTVLVDEHDNQLSLGRDFKSRPNESSHEHGHHHHHGRSFTEIRRIIEGSALSNDVKTRSVAIFRRLGEAEARIHGKDIEEIHFHEVGAVDAIVDIVGVCICLGLLGVDKVYASPMPTFHGTVEIAHGTFPLPAPATAEILRDVPWRQLGIEGELVTPTGAAIVAELASTFGPMPPMQVSSIGYGAGKKDFNIPNVLRVMVGEEVSAELDSELSTLHSPLSTPCDVALLETNIDDSSPQVYDVLMDRLLAAGALDVYLTSIQMKKNRPAVLVSVICSPDEIDKMSNVLFEETSTIGIRVDRRSRICLQREIQTVDTRFGPIRIKIARRGGEVVNAQPEYDDCKSAAATHGLPFALVRDTALSAFLAS